MSAADIHEERLETFRKQAVERLRAGRLPLSQLRPSELSERLLPLR